MPHKDSPHLKWEDRPECVKQEIHKAFERVVLRGESTWGYNGTIEYDLLFIDELNLIKSIILSNPDRKEFYVLDIGAGEFGLNNILLKSINDDEEIPKDIKVHLIGIRGEVLFPYKMAQKNLSEQKERQEQTSSTHPTKSRLATFFSRFKTTSPIKKAINMTITASQPSTEEPFLAGNIVTHKISKCIQYNIGNFQIENMLEQFDALSSTDFPIKDLDKKVDVIFSSFTFIHLIDPLGTLIQAYSLLRPKTGCILMDGFYYSIPKEDRPGSPGRPTVNEKLKASAVVGNFDVESNIYIYELLLSLNLPFLINGQSHAASLNHFMLQRPDEKELELPLNYIGIQSHQKYTHRLPNAMAAFVKTKETPKVESLYKSLYMDVTGTPELYVHLKKTGALVRKRNYRSPNFYPLEMVFAINSQTKQQVLSDLSVASLTRGLNMFVNKERTTDNDQESALVCTPKPKIKITIC